MRGWSWGLQWLLLWGLGDGGWWLWVGSVLIKGLDAEDAEVWILIGDWMQWTQEGKGVRALEISNR